eukprot:SAG11_NODE_606_length_8231_cov_5.017462_3_plen_215_part_00
MGCCVGKPVTEPVKAQGKISWGRVATDQDGPPALPSVPNTRNMDSSSTLSAEHDGFEELALSPRPKALSTQKLTKLEIQKTRKILHAGFLRKKKDGKNWKTRWCVVEDGRMTYYRGKKGGKELPSGYIDLDTDCDVVENIPPDTKGINTADPEFGHAFLVHTSEGPLDAEGASRPAGEVTAAAAAAAAAAASVDAQSIAIAFHGLAHTKMSHEI